MFEANGRVLGEHWGYHYGTVFRYRWNFGPGGGGSNLGHGNSILSRAKSRQTDPTMRIAVLLSVTRGGV